MPDWNIRLGFLVTTLLFLSTAATRAQEPISGPDILVNDPSLDVDGSTQSETSVVAVGSTVCVAWNDSGEGSGVSGFGFSNDAGKTFTDGGGLPPGPNDVAGGDPSLAYSERDGAFYYAALSTKGLSVWKSSDDCQTFQYVGPIHEGFLDDKELMIVDNGPSSPFYGRIYVGWTDFTFLGGNPVSYSDDGGLHWSTPVRLPGTDALRGQGMWPAVAPNGDVFFSLRTLVGKDLDQLIYRSLDGGATWQRMTDIASDLRDPQDAESTTACRRPALNGEIRHLSSAQIVAQRSESAPAGYVLHAVYPNDSDGSGPDTSNVFYRRSIDGAQTWLQEHKLNDDATDTDQWFPAVTANELQHVVVSWYDRRLDAAGNLLFDRFMAVSDDGGLSWKPNRRVSDVTSAVSENQPHFDSLAPCYHGDYDQIAVDKSKAYVVWSDDRRLTATGPNPDVYFNQAPLIPRGALEAAVRLLLLP